MSEHHAAHDADESVDHHPGARQYTIVGVILAIITLTEVWAYTLPDLRPLLVPVLMILSAAKFILVVAFFMHLKFDHPMLTAVFGFGLAVAASVITALLFLFGQYPFPIHQA